MFFTKHHGATTKSAILGDVFRTWSKLRLVAIIVLTVVLPAGPSFAQNVVYISATGGNINCIPVQPCADIPNALAVVGANNPGTSTRVICLNGSTTQNSAVNFSQSSVSLDIDCPLGFIGALTFRSGADNAKVRVRHLGFKDSGFGNLFAFASSGTVILEDCVFTDANPIAVDIEPNGLMNLVIRNSRISNGGSGILLKPAAGGIIKATFDHVAITSNSGGGIKADSTNGPVYVDVTDSEISNNGGNGINAVGAIQNIVSVAHSVIAKNAVAGIQANGPNAAVIVSTTLLDLNGTGATSVVNSGNMITYGNNRIIGSLGSAFTSSDQLL
jgi:hypothetical protein